MRQGRKTAEWLKKNTTSLRTCFSAFHWPFSNAVALKEWAIQKSCSMGPGSAFLPRFFPFSPTAEPGSRLKEVRSSYYSEKGLAYNSIIMFCLLLKLIFVIVFRFNRRSHACAFFDKFSPTRSSVWFSCNKSWWSDSYATEFKGKTFFVFDIVNVFRVDESEPEFALDAIYPPWDCGGAACAACRAYEALNS